MLERMPKRARKTTPEDLAGYQLWHAAMWWRHELLAALEPLELTHTQFFLLGSMHYLQHTAGELPTQGELAAHAGLDPMTVSQVTRALQKRGLVERTRDDEDRRAYRLELTDSGRRLAQRAFPRVREVEERFFSVLGRNKRSFVEALKTLTTER